MGAVVLIRCLSHPAGFAQGGAGGDALPTKFHDAILALLGLLLAFTYFPCRSPNTTSAGRWS